MESPPRGSQEPLFSCSARDQALLRELDRLRQKQPRRLSVGRVFLLRAEADFEQPLRHVGGKRRFDGFDAGQPLFRVGHTEKRKAVALDVTQRIHINRSALTRHHRR